MRQAKVTKSGSSSWGLSGKLRGMIFVALMAVAFVACNPQACLPMQQATPAPVNYAPPGCDVNVLTDDCDQDGMNNGWEVAHRLNPLDAGDANGDFDKDGYSNYQEYVNGTDPWVANSGAVRTTTTTTPSSSSYDKKIDNKNDKIEKLRREKNQKARQLRRERRDGD